MNDDEKQKALRHLRAAIAALDEDARFEDCNPYLSPSEAMGMLPMDDNAGSRRSRFEYLVRIWTTLRTRKVGSVTKVHLEDWRIVCLQERRRGRSG
jgi:hypothetical protein